jgi:hypothetical protein
MGRVIISSAQAANLNESCASAACFEVFASEFDESKIRCNMSATSATVCRCKFQVLDLTACVIINSMKRNGGQEDSFNLVVNEVGIVASNKFTSTCRIAIEQRGPCELKGIVDHGFKITTTEKVLTSAGIGFEMLLAYQMVLFALQGFVFKKFSKLHWQVWWRKEVQTTSDLECGSADPHILSKQLLHQTQ